MQKKLYLLIPLLLLLAIFTLFITSCSDEEAKDTGMVSSLAGENGIEATVSFVNNGETYSVTSDKSGFFLLTLKGEFPTKVDVTVNYKDKTKKLPGYILEDAPPPEEPPKDDKAKKWNILIWLDGNNDLEKYLEENLEDMETAGSSNDVNVFAVYGFWSRDGAGDMVMIRNEKEATTKVANGVFMGRVMMEDEDIVLKQTPKYSRILKHYENIDMASSGNLTEFYETVTKFYPADKTMLVINDHGSLFKNMRSQLRYFCHDAVSDENMTLFEFTESLKNVEKKPDILAFDACLMATIEAACQFKSLVNEKEGLLIASPEATSAHGWPYGKIISSLIQSPDMKIQDLANNIIDNYIAKYSEKGYENEAISAIDLTKTDEISKNLDKLAQTLTELINKDAKNIEKLKNWRKSVLSYGDNDFADIKSMILQIQTAGILPNNELTTKIVENINALVIKQGNTGGKIGSSCGISIYFPLNAIDDNKLVDLDGNKYQDFVFSTKDYAPLWFSFIETFNQKLVPYVMEITPEIGTSDGKVILKGYFGETEGTVKLADKDAEIISWEAEKIEIKVPADLKNGEIKVTANSQTSNIIAFSNPDGSKTTAKDSETDPDVQIKKPETTATEKDKTKEPNIKEKEKEGVTTGDKLPPAIKPQTQQ